MPDLKDIFPVRRAHWKSFKLDLKGKGDKTSLAREKPGGSTSIFGGQCASKLLQSAASVAVGWRWMEIHGAAKMQGALRC